MVVSLQDQNYIQQLREEEREGRTVDKEVETLRKRINILEQLAHKNQMEAAGRQQSYHDAHAKAHTFDVNDSVWYYRKSSLARGVTSKLKYSWTGPFRVSKVIGPVTYVLEDVDGNQLPGTYHARYLYKVPNRETGEGREV